MSEDTDEDIDAALCEPEEVCWLCGGILDVFGFCVADCSRHDGKEGK